MSRSVSLGLLLTACFIPAILVAEHGLMSVGALGLAGLVVLLGQAALLYRLGRGLNRMTRVAEAMRDEPERPPPDCRPADTDLIALWDAVLGWERAAGRNHAALKEAFDGTRAVLDALPDPLLLLGKRRDILGMNPVARALFGPHVKGRDLAAAMRHPTLLAAADAALADGGERLVEFELLQPTERQMSARLDPLPRPTAEGAVLLVLLHDLTAMKQAEQMRADFVANASHELRTPLSTLIGFIETLLGPAANDPEAQARFLAIMQQQAGRMARLVEDLLALSRIELNEHSPPKENLQIAPLLRDVIESLILKAAQREMRLVLRVSDLAPSVPGDLEELTQVFQNLVENAIKYGREKSEVVVAMEDSNRLRNALAISVIDQGEGIERRHIPRLTERFYRIDTARSRAMGGTGLGLAIVKHIVNRHRGMLEITSERGRGSVFTVHLPTAGTGAGTRRAGNGSAVAPK